MLKVKSTKSYFNLATAHCQWFDKESDGTPGDCASLHGYDRSVHFEFSGDVDEQGWIFPFGELRDVKEFLEYYFDHTSLFPANDPRLKDIPNEMLHPGGILGTARVLPYGVSMEMSSLFVWEQVNPYIHEITGGRVVVTRVEIKEHERNSGFIEVSDSVARAQADRVDVALIKQPYWDYRSPQAVVEAINSVDSHSEEIKPSEEESAEIKVDEGFLDDLIKEMFPEIAKRRSLTGRPTQDTWISVMRNNR